MTNLSEEELLRETVRARLQAVQQILEQLVARDSTADASTKSSEDTSPNSPVDSPGSPVEASHAVAPPEPSFSKLVHQLRVNCRRAETALRATLTVWPNRTTISVIGQLRKLRKSMNKLRDAEVMLSWLDKQSQELPLDTLDQTLSGIVHHERKKLVERVRRLLERKSWSRHFQRLIAENTPVRLWRRLVGEWLFETLRDTLVALPEPHADPEQLHEFRIKAKHLRYGVELLDDLDTRVKLKRQIKRLKGMQDRLGTIQDGVVRIPLLRKLGRHQPPTKPLMQAAGVELQQALSDWEAWRRTSALRKAAADLSRICAELLIRAPATDPT